MPAPVTIQVGGLTRAAEQMKLAAAGVQKEFRDALREAAEVVRMDARRRAPRRSGKLAGSLRVAVRERGFGVGARVLTRSPYAGVVMFGRRASHDGHGHKVPHVRRLRPRPFLIHAQMAHRHEVRARVTRAVEQLLARVFRG